LPDVFRGVVIRVQAVPTLFTEEETLRFTIGTVLMPTRRACLAGVPRIYLHNLHAAFLRLIRDEVVELSKRPGMQPTLCRDILVLFAASNLAGFSDVLEVFQNNSAPGGGVLNNSLAQNMIAISVETRLTLAQLLEMTFRGFRSFRLQLSPYAKILAVSLFPVLIAKELALRGDGWAVQAQIDPDDLITLRNIGFRDLDHDMQPILPLAIYEISSGYPVSLILGLPSGNSKGNTHLATGGREPSRLLCPIKRVGVDVIPRSTKLAGRTLHWLELRGWFAILESLLDSLGMSSLMLLFPSKSTGKGFSGFDTGLDEQITHQTRTGPLCIMVRLMMQTHSILLLMLPTISTYLVERLRELRNRLIQGLSLLRSRMQLYSYGSVHAKSIPYM